jgi:hypothetical protein
MAAVDAPELASDLVDVYEEGGSPPAPSPQALGGFELAWPTILAFGTQTLVRVVSLLMVGSLGQSAIAGVGVANQFFWLRAGVRHGGADRSSRCSRARWARATRGWPTPRCARGCGSGSASA